MIYEVFSNRNDSVILRYSRRP